MGLFDKLFKKEKKPFTSDKAEWQYQSCLEAFCKEKGKNQNELTQTDIDYIWECSGLLISYFLAWLINNNYIKTDISEESINEIKERRISASKFFGREFDYTLLREDISESIIDFVDDYYYDGFYSDYSNYIENNCHKNIFLSDFSWEDYDNIEKIINESYIKYKK